MYWSYNVVISIIKVTDNKFDEIGASRGQFSNFSLFE